jgi:hypothetical protein
LSIAEKEEKAARDKLNKSYDAMEIKIHGVYQLEKKVKHIKTIEGDPDFSIEWDDPEEHHHHKE